MERILVVDDDGDLRAIIADVLKDEGFCPAEAEDGLHAVRAFKADAPDAVLLDLRMPYMDGMETMQRLREINPDVPIIILTAHGDIRTAVEAIRNGAYDFIEKPPEFDKLVITLKRSFERTALLREISSVSTAFELSLESIFGKSDSIKKVIGQIKQVARTDFSVTIQGETGTGKSHVARTIHDMSSRADKPFVRIDIGLVPETLAESELFGYRKGAFTGADKNRKGYFENAGNGTIFMDEIENMPLNLQAKFLSVIDEKKIYPLGSAAPVESYVRIIAATNRDIADCVKRREFREDLFYRLCEFIITLPPLRDRREDIPFFAEKFLYEASIEANKQLKNIAHEALLLLKRHDWPGNLRELKNVIKRAVLFSEGDTVNRECIEESIKAQPTHECPPPFMTLKNAVKELEKKLIREALEKTDWNKTKAAELLGTSYKNLFDKIKEYGIQTQ